MNVIFSGIAVVIKNEIYFYRNCKPYHKYSIQPTIVQDSEECKLWQESNNASDLLERLRILSSSVGFVNLTSTSQQMLCLNECYLQEYFEKYKKVKLIKQASIIINQNNFILIFNLINRIL